MSANEKMNEKRRRRWRYNAEKRGMAKEKCGRDGERRAECRLWQSASGPRLVVLCKRFKVGALLTSQRLRRMSWCKLWARLRKRHQKLTHKKRQLIFLALTLVTRMTRAWRETPHDCTCTCPGQHTRAGLAKHVALASQPTSWGSHVSKYIIGKWEKASCIFVYPDSGSEKNHWARARHATKTN